MIGGPHETPTKVGATHGSSLSKKNRVAQTLVRVPGDVDGDSDCDSYDPNYLARYLGFMLPSVDELPYPEFRGDVNCDGNINGADITYLNNYLAGPGPAPKCCYWLYTDTLTTYYIYSNGQVLTEYDDDGSLVWNYVYGLG